MKISEQYKKELINNALADVVNTDIQGEPITMSDIVLDRWERYDLKKTNCLPYRKKNDQLISNGQCIIMNLGNMIGGYPFEMLGHLFKDSECAYIAGAYSNAGADCRKIQEELSAFTKGGYAAKQMYRKANNEVTALVREDWESFNIAWMMLVIWSKVQSNSQFKDLLMSIPRDAHLIEDTSRQNGSTATIWGAKNPILTSKRKEKIALAEKMLKTDGVTVQKTIDEISQRVENRMTADGVFEGKNLMGKILKLISTSLLDGVEPPIDWELLNNKDIYWFGEKLNFPPCCKDIVL